MRFALPMTTCRTIVGYVSQAGLHQRLWSIRLYVQLTIHLSPRFQKPGINIEDVATGICDSTLL